MTPPYDEIGLGGEPRDLSINGWPLRRIVDAGQRTLDVSHRVPQLLGRATSELPSGRVPIYVCELCADVGCGAVTVRVEVQSDCVVWSDFAFETPWESSAITFHDERWDRAFHFTRDAYERVFY